MIPNAENFSERITLFRELLTVPSDRELKEISTRIASLKIPHYTELTFHRNHFQPAKYKFSKKFCDSWNKHIVGLAAEKSVQAALQSLYDFDVSEAIFKLFLFRLIAAINEDTCKQLTTEHVTQLVASYEIDDKVELLTGLSVLELCLLISIKHHSEIYDRDPFNFEIIFSRFTKFSKVSTSMQGIERAVVLKAFEHLRNIEFILPLTTAACKVQKEFEMHKMALTSKQINQAVQKYQALPTEVSQWAQSSLI